MGKAKKWLWPILVLVFIVITLLVIRNRKKLFKSNPYKFQYTKIKNLRTAVEKGIGPNNEKTFFITFGSNTCPACKAHYEVMNTYIELGKDKNMKDGFIPYYIVDTDAENDEAIVFAFDHIEDEQYVTWQNPHDKTKFKQITVPTTFFIKNSKLIEIINGRADKPEQVISYVKKNI